VMSAAVSSTKNTAITAALITLGVYLLATLYFALYSRHHLVAQAPEEEFAALAQAEAELVGS